MQMAVLQMEVLQMEVLQMAVPENKSTGWKMTELKNDGTEK